ncbi:hypothetical protein GCM10010387_57540 [Streptomyces inusitatus]|uniref:Uncharacterized protein n=1 Tax=Streptomyces inusitatus TaxID=68221 RepID=A0A918V1T7_9ACTN|nr:hypothetical protein [Streptomyces inusitatus]GGZ55913.1 hypothetical protein GCM10010387_57540 [Streptomyces inusitatus]
MTTAIAHPRDAFPVDGRLPRSFEPPTGPETRPWILRFARRPDSHQVTVVPEARYD